MKKVISFILMIVTVTACLFGGCFKEDKKNALVIEAHSAGYGEDWIAFMAQEFEKETGIKVTAFNIIGNTKYVACIYNADNYRNNQ